MAQSPEPAPAQALAPIVTLEFGNIADDFLAFWDATRDLPTSDRVTAFKRDIAPLFPDFYGIERFAGRTTQEQQDERIAAAINEFPQLREGYAAKVEAFDRSLTRNLETFRAAFPTFRPDVEVHLVHSLGEMDGGMRTLGGRPHLIFGADVMARSLAGANDSAFFHHELFHVHHRAAFGPCGEVWCSVWREGLAVHVAEQLNPGATPQELLMSFPPNLVADTEAQIGPSWAHLNTVLASTNRDNLAGLTDTRPGVEGLPRRRGYYLGYLIAKRLGASRNLQTLANLSAEQVRPLVFAAVAEFMAEHPVAAQETPPAS